MNEHSLEECVRRNLENYFRSVPLHEASGIWDMVMSAVERPVLETIMLQARGNQSKAAEMLGINRNTLRKKLEQHQLKP